MRLETLFAALGIALCGFVAKADASAMSIGTLSGEVTLTEDYDYRGLELKIADDCKIDLNGHSFFLSLGETPTTRVTFTDSTVESALAGTLHIEVPSGKTVHVGTYSFTGTMKVQKEGAGTLELPNGTPYAETGDTTVAAGSVKFTGETAIASGTGVIIATNSMPVIDLNGQTVAVKNIYDQGTLVNSVADLATVVLGRGDTDATLGFLPPANVKLRKEGAGTLTVNGPFIGKLDLAAGKVVCRKPAFRHYRFVVLRPWGSTATAVQFSEFKLLDGEIDVTLLGSVVSQDEGSPEPSAAANAVDRNLDTKFYDKRASGGNYAENKGSVYVQLSYDAPRPITGYSWATADDRPNVGSDGRDPADWLLLGSDDGKTWVTLDKRTEYYATTERKTWVGPFVLPFSEAMLAEVTSESANTSLTLDGTALAPTRLCVHSLDLVQGGKLIVSGLSQCKWYRWSVKALESGTSMQVGEFALYDAAGKRLNQGLVRGSSATALEPGMFFADGEVGTGEYLFDDSKAGKWWVGDNAPSPSNPDSWNVVTMRLADDAAPVAGYNIMTADDSASWCARNPKQWSLEVSADGVNWLTVDERSVSQGPHENYAWYNGDSPYAVGESIAAVVTGSGEVVKKGNGEATFQGSFAGNVGLRVESGRLTVIPEFSRCKWYRWSVKELESGKSMQVGEFALYDAAGKRLNQGLASGSSATALGPGMFFADGEVGTGEYLFDGADVAGKWWVGDNAPSPSNPDSWNVVTMRLADDAAPVAGYDIETANDSEANWSRNPKSWMLEVSADGVNWMTVDEQSVSQGPHANFAWYSGGKTYAVNGGIVASPESASLGKVSLAAGAELALSVAMPVKGLEVDASGGSSISRLELASGGVLDIVNAPDGFEVPDEGYIVPLAIGELSGSTAGWTVWVNGIERRGLYLRKLNGGLCIRPTGLTILIR